MATLSVPLNDHQSGSWTGATGVNVKDVWGNSQPVEIRPGTSIEATLFDPQNPFYAGAVAAGRLVIGE